MSRLAMAACGLSQIRELVRSFPAAVRPSRPRAASPSMMKTALVVAVVSLVWWSRFQALGCHHEHAVVRAQLEYLGGHADGSEERACVLARLSRGQQSDHRAAPPPTAGSNTVRAKRAASAELGFAYPWGR